MGVGRGPFDLDEHEKLKTKMTASVQGNKKRSFLISTRQNNVHIFGIRNL